MFKKAKLKKILLFALIFSAVLACAAILPHTMINTEASIESEISALQNQIKQKQAAQSVSANKKKDLQNQIASLKNQQEDVRKEKRLYDDLIALIEAEIQETEELIENLNRLMELTDIEIGKAQETYDKSYELFLDMIKFTYEEGNTNYISMLLDSENFTNFLYRIDIISNLVEYTKNVITRLQRDRNTLDVEKFNRAEALKQQEEYSQELEAYRKDAEKLQQEANANLNKLENDVKKAEAEQRQMEQDEAKIQNDIKNALREIELKRQQQQQEQQKFVGGAWLWPTDPAKSRKISSPFANRINPVTKRPEHHNGIDIPADNGSNIYAVNDGTVLLAVVSNTGYGNYIIIDHGDGITTLYAHNSKNLKKVGDKVVKGDVIALIGTTGMSTGYHLHFGYYVNAEPKNPLLNGFKDPKG